MTNEDLTAIATYLTDIPASAPETTHACPATIQEGEAIWWRSCAPCHGIQAQGFVDIVPDLHDLPECRQLKATTLARVIVAGIESKPIDLPMPA